MDQAQPQSMTNDWSIQSRKEGEGEENRRRKRMGGGPVQDTKKMPPHALVLGAGISGLAAGLHLLRKGVRVTLLEARDRVGGRIHRQDGVELGASILHGELGNPVKQLLAEAQIPIAPQELGGILLPTGERLPRKLETQLQQNVFSFFALRELAQTTDPEPSASLACFLDPSSSLFHNIPPSQRYIAQSLGRSFEGWTASKLEDVSLRWWGHEQDFEGEDLVVGGKGYGGLVNFLRDKIQEEGGVFKLDQEVVKTEDGEEDVTATTTSADTTKTIYTAPHVVCTLPLGVLQSHLAPSSSDSLFSPSLPPRRLKSIANLGFGLLDKLVLRYPSAWWMRKGKIPPRGWFFLLPETGSDDNEALGLFANDSLEDGSAILLFFLGPSLGERLEKRSEDEVGAWAHERAVKGFGGGGDGQEKPSKVTLTRWRADPFSRGSYTYIPPTKEGETASPSPVDILELARPVWDGKLGFAGEHTSVNHYASVHGAWLSGVAEAERVLARVEGEEEE